MSDIKKWMKIVESVSPVLASQSPSVNMERDSVVALGPRVGGGVGRFVKFTGNGGALIDVKGVVREFADGDFSPLDRSTETGNDWFHMSVTDDTLGTSNSSPEFKPGDMVKIADVYGTVIGPGFGVFIGYGTTGEDCIILFDGKQIVVPVENVASVLEQDAKDNFSETDNDGTLSPMSLGSDNVKIEQPQTGMSVQEPTMDHKDEFTKWMEAVEEALTGEIQPAPDMNTDAACGCGEWNCPVCFPDQEGLLGGTDHNHNADMDVDMTFSDDHMHEPNIVYGEEDFTEVPMEEEPQEFEQQPRSKDGRGVKLGDIVQKTEYRKVGQDSPMTYGEDNLDEDIPLDADEEDYGKAGRYAQDHFGNLGEDEDFEQKDEMISSIEYMQSMGLSKSPEAYTREELELMPMQDVKAHYDQVMGTVTESIVDEELIDESTLSKLIGKQKGGQLLVQWLHRKHKLSNEAELVPASFNERIFWKQFKSNPDDFVIISGSGGVAGIKPSIEYIQYMQQKFAAKKKVYNPSGDANLQYQAIAFTDSGEKIDPALLQAAPKDGEEPDYDKFRSVDPTVIKARMGLHHGRDSQNPDNVFNLIAEQIGGIRTVWISGFENAKDAGPGKGSVERDKIAQRSEIGAERPAPRDRDETGARKPPEGKETKGRVTFRQPEPPEDNDINLKESVMNEVDKDVAAMLNSLKKYDMLAESAAPVLGMVTLGEKKKPDADGDGVPDWADKKPGEDDHEKVDEEGNPWEKLAKKDDEKKEGETSKTHKGGTVTQTKSGLQHKGTYGGEKDSVKEGADPEVLEWMQRFANLGNMKGYGR